MQEKAQKSPAEISHNRAFGHIQAVTGTHTIFVYKKPHYR
jgi:hypothetical protein